MVSRLRGPLVVVLFVAFAAVGGCALLDAFTGVPAGSKCHTDQDCVPGSCLGGSDGGTAWPGGYCTSSCDPDGGVCGPGAACASSADGGTCLATCIWDGGESSCRTSYVCDRHRAGPSAACVPACGDAADCTTESLACEHGFCCGGPGERCCASLGPCRGGYVCGSDDYCEASHPGNADGGVPTNDGGQPTNDGGPPTNDGGTNGGCALGACPAQVLATGQSFPMALAVDSTNVYWTDHGDGHVMAVPIGGGSPQVLASGQSGPWGVATDGTKVYWTDRATGQVMAVAVGGGTPRTLTSGQAQPEGIATDGVRVYWANTQGGQIEAVATTGGIPTPLATGQGSPAAVAVDAQNVYWANTGGNGDVMEVSKSGGNPTVLAAGVYSTSVAVDSANVYYGRNDGRWLEVPIGGGSPVVLTPNSTYVGNGVASDGSNVCWTDGRTDQVFALPLAGGTPVVIGPSVSGLSPQAIAVDANNVYWAESGVSGEIMEAQK